MGDDQQQDEELLSFDEALQVLGTSRPTLYRLLSQGDLKGLKVGRQWRFRRNDLHAYMERSPVAQAAPPAPDMDAELDYFASELSEYDEMQPVVIEDAEMRTDRLAKGIIRLAINRKSSDIHLEPTNLEGETCLLVRYRIDGVLHEIRRMPISLHEALIAHFKIVSEVQVAEKRVAQDGRLLIKHDGKDFDLRISVMPAFFGESLVIRILDRSAVMVGLEKLGFLPDNLEQLERMIRQPNGLLFISGPTGSGKTTTLYSCLCAIGSIEKKTLTIEDPVEYIVPNATQVQVNRRAGLTYSAALRAFMRQDPDIIYIGEVRDPETLMIAVEASLTGHLVLSTLHTNDAPSTITRILDMGIEPYLVSASFLGVVAQRLARRLCRNCKKPMEQSEVVGLEPIRKMAAAGGFEVPNDAVFYQAVGCDLCRERGFKGRLGLYEIIEFNEALSEAVVRGDGAEQISKIALSCGMRTLWADGMRKVVAGETTIDEIRRVVFTAGF